jgi:hypothetical protein
VDRGSVNDTQSMDVVERPGLQQRKNRSNKKTARTRSMASPAFVEISLGVRLGLLVKMLVVDSSGDENRSHGYHIAKPGHARRKVGALFRRYAMKPMPQKPRIIMAQVEGSGTAGAMV